MKTTIALALSALLANSLVVAYPSKRHEGHAHLHKKRDLVVVTENVYETVYSTTTIWVDPTAGGEFYEQPPAKETKATPSSPVASSAVPYVAPSSAAPYVAPSSSSVYVAPSSSVYVAPSSAAAAAVSSSSPTPSSSSVYVTPSSAYVAPTPTEPTSSAAAAATSAASVASTNDGAYSGDVTYYNPAGGYGACGFTIADSDPVVAIAHDTWDTLGTESNGNPWCNKKIIITNKSTGKTFSATIGDKCMGTDATPCTGGNLDLTQGLFEQAFPEVDGRGKGVMSWTLA